LSGKLETELQASTRITPGEKNRLQKVLQTGALPAEELMRMEHVPGPAGSRP
jgi:hypothetical protein